MGIYIKSFCPHCKKPLGGWDLNYRGIGSPFFQCKSCGKVYQNPRVNEWEYLSPMGKFLIYWATFYTGCLIAFGITAILAIVVFFVTDNNETILFSFNFIVGIISFIGAEIYMFKINSKEIIKSKKRMKNQEYRHLLEKMNNIQ
ncbi:hypothetical protein ACFL2I_07070 [Candidatus Omnitrophota bacterium]